MIFENFAPATLAQQFSLTPQAAECLSAYLVSLPEAQIPLIPSVSADYFCADKENADICAELVRMGQKQATCSMKYWYLTGDEQGPEPMPQTGHLLVVTNWDGEPVAITQVTSVSEARFKDVTADFAAAEGEGDQSLSWWRKAHWQFFSTECEALGIEMSEEIPLVLERFKTVWAKAAA
ncbi:ASCH domain-containing protein [Photobacterium sp. CCB-ST2H9]|nr:ASCH domain-containing protein [Photobacterium sp. CCB-ST2H9]UTM59848.1 ASCH domain-containing protein [Photobacterium sp. CCB-ST2H9]